MFNSPRPARGNTTTFGGSFVDDNPLAGSAYDDPWSNAPSPSQTPTPGPGSATSVFSSVIGVIFLS